MTRQELEQTGLIEMFVMGLTSDEESAIVRAAMEKDPELAAEIQGLQQSFTSYIKAHASVPPADLKESVMKEVADCAEPVVPSSTNKTGRSKSIWTKAALITLTLISGFLAWNYLDVRKALDASRDSVIACEEDKNRIIQENTSYAELQNFLSNPATQYVTLAGTANAPEARIVAFVNNVEQKTMYQILDMPKPPQGKVYQMWADVEGEMINMGLISTEDGMQLANFIPNAESINITLENAGGADHPNVEALMAVGVI